MSIIDLQQARKATPPNTAIQHLTPLALETRTAVTTAEAAAHLNRAPQTLRLWAMREDGPLRPMRICGRLAWKTEDLRRVLGVA